MTKREELRKIGLFRDLSEEEFAILSGMLKRKVYHPEETIFTENGSGQTLYIISKGEVRVCKEGTSGEMQTITLLKDDEIFGELSFLDNRPHSATIIAMVETEVYQLEMEDFEQLIPKHPYLVFKIMKGIAFTIHSIIRAMNRRYVEMVGYMWGRNR